VHVVATSQLEPCQPKLQLHEQVEVSAPIWVPSGVPLLHEFPSAPVVQATGGGNWQLSPV
ncbi:MAG: hypothetical protein K0U10_06710, partial [Gammaproteobacteria bacterium]|nr:hypothetical protein [Gammaproteobacteria bacterium]